MELGLSAGDVIDVLEAHNAGKAQKVIQTFKLAGSSNAEKCLQTIEDKLKERFSHSSHRALGGSLVTSQCSVTRTKPGLENCLISVASFSRYLILMI